MRLGSSRAALTLLKNFVIVPRVIFGTSGDYHLHVGLLLLPLALQRLLLSLPMKLRHSTVLLLDIRLRKDSKLNRQSCVEGGRLPLVARNQARPSFTYHGVLPLVGRPECAQRHRTFSAEL